MTSKKGGGRRRYAVAETLWIDRLSDETYQRFYAACSTFDYRDIMAVSRSLGVTPRTVTNWKYRKTLPQEGIVSGIVSWVEDGKPIITIPADQLDEWCASASKWHGLPDSVPMPGSDR